MLPSRWSTKNDEHGVANHTCSYMPAITSATSDSTSSCLGKSWQSTPTSKSTTTASHLVHSIERLAEVTCPQLPGEDDESSAVTSHLPSL